MAAADLQRHPRDRYVILDPPPSSPILSLSLCTLHITGNTSPILLELYGLTTPASWGEGYTYSLYAPMYNVMLDMHIYGWAYNNEQVHGGSSSADVTYLQTAIAANVQSAQGYLPMANGKMPVISAEYGPSTTGQTLDPNGYDLVTALFDSTNSGVLVGAAAWEWAPYGANYDILTENNQLTSPYGTMVAAWIAA